MCGIAGVVALPGGAPVEAARLESMCASIRHRGPDDQGSYFGHNGAVAMAMRRLAIIDVAGGHQPVFNEDETVATVFNGELYNFRDLRRELEACGHRFRTASDTEVIVHLWEEAGADLLTRLNGMFAIALHDRRRGRFLLARDHLGIKPLYYCRTQHHLIFGSEIKAILASGLVDPELDIDGLAQYLPWEYVPAPRTLFRSVCKLEPGQSLEIALDDGRMDLRYFWDVSPGDPTGDTSPHTEAEWADLVDDALRRAVQAQLVSDVPLGALLSGGVDSSLVVAAMGEGKAFSIGFDDRTYDEVIWAKRVAAHLDLDHRIELIRPEALELFDRLMHHMDDPIADFSIFPTYQVSRLARREVTVALTGDGGDELFGGYETYVAQAMARHWQRIPAFLRQSVIATGIERLRPSPKKKGLINRAKRFVEGATKDDALAHARWRMFVDEALLQRLFTPEAAAARQLPADAHITELFARAGPRGEVDRWLYVDMKSYLADNCLVKVDRMSMACSLEARVPFLDRHLVELAFRVPAELKTVGHKTKVLLKRIAARHVPRACIDRPKQGFSIPIKNWLKADFRPLMEELLATHRVRAEGIFDVATVERLKSEHLSDRANHSHVLWALMVFQDWRRRWAVSS